MPFSPCEVTFAVPRDAGVAAGAAEHCESEWPALREPAELERAVREDGRAGAAFGARRPVGGVGADDVVVADLLAVLQQLLAEDERVADREALLAGVDLRERVLLRRVGERARALALGRDRDGSGDDK